MLFLHFRIGQDELALAAERIVEIVPLAGLALVRQAGGAAAPALDYRGSFIPVIDLAARELGRPAPLRMSTRIIVVRTPDAAQRLVGLVAEHATGTLRCHPAAFAPFARGPEGVLIQRVELEDLLPASALASLPVLTPDMEVPV